MQNLPDRVTGYSNSYNNYKGQFINYFLIHMLIFKLILYNAKQLLLKNESIKI